MIQMAWLVRTIEALNFGPEIYFAKLNSLMMLFGDLTIFQFRAPLLGAMNVLAVMKR
jgi:hypothetical protein